MVAHWGAFARKYMFKFWKIEMRRRAIIMRQNMARRTLIRTNPQYGPFRPVDIHECSSDSDDEPTISVAPAASDVPTAAPGRSSQPVARIDRALDVLNAPGSSGQEFQAYFNPKNLGPGDLEELSPELWEKFRVNGAADEHDLHMQDLADEEAQGTEPDLDRPPGLSEAAIADIPRTTLSSLEEQNPELHRDIIIGLQATRDRDPRDPESPLISEPEADDQPGSHGPGNAPGASSMPRTAQGRRWRPRPPCGGPHDVALAGCDVPYQSDLVRVDTRPVVDMWSPEEDQIWGALDEGCNSTCDSKAWGELAEARLRVFGLTFPWIDGSTKSFAGLGSSTKTLGKRNLPFCIQVGEDSLAGAMESHEIDTSAFNPLLVSLFAQAKLGLIKDMAHCKCYIGDLEVPMARCAHTGLLLLCLSQFSRRSKLPRARVAMMLSPSLWQVWPDVMIVTVGVKHCFLADDHRGVSSADAWRSFLPKAIANRKIILTDTRQLSNPESDRGSTERHCIGRNLGIINEQLDSGTGMYLLQSTFEAIEKETKLHPQLVVLDFCNANRHRSVAKGTIMSCISYVKGIEHGLLHLNGMNNWRFMRCGGSCSKCRDMDIPTATRVGQRACNSSPMSMTMTRQTAPTSKGGHCRCHCLPGASRPGLGLPLPLGDPLQLSQVQSVGPQVGLRPQATTSTLGPCGTVKTTNKVPGVVKQEEPEVPNKDPKGSQTLKLSTQSSSSAGPGPQSEVVAMAPITPKPKPMPVRRGDASQEASIPTQPVYATGRPVIPPPGAPGTGSGPRQPPTPPPSGVVEPEPANDQVKVKFWRDRALYAEARLAERDRQLQQQGQQILDLSWRAKVAEDWTEWWEHRRHEFPVHSRPSTRTVRQSPSPSTERRSRSRSVSASVTRQTGRSVTPTPKKGSP